MDEGFLQQWRAGFAAYQKGAWQEAQALLQGTRSCRRRPNGDVIEDGPSATLLRFMEGHDFNAPRNWKGFRELTDK